jgi:hypothetical protein
MEDNAGGPPGGNKIFMHEGIVGHAIWKRNDFWESAILQSIKEEFSSQHCYGTEETNVDEEIMREKNVVFGQLGCFAFNMLTFHLDPHIVKVLISRFCRHFNLSEMMTKDIIVTVSSSICLTRVDKRRRSETKNSKSEESCYCSFQSREQED